MDRVTSDIAERVCELLRDAYLTGAEALRIRCAVSEAESRGKSRKTAADLAAEERLRAHYRRHYAKGGEPLKVIDWSAPYEAEAVAQGQDGPDPAYAVAPRFGGAEMRSVPADRPEGAPDALAGLYAIQAGEAAVAGDPPANPDDDGDDDDPDNTPLVVPFTDEQEGE